MLLAIPGGLFDEAITAPLAAAFLADPLHRLVLAFDGDLVVGKTSGSILLSPDKPPEFFVNEVDMREAWQRRGVAKAMLALLIAELRAESITDVWIGTEHDNQPARALYRSAGGRVKESVVVYAWEAPGR